MDEEGRLRTHSIRDTRNETKKNKLARVRTLASTRRTTCPTIGFIVTRACVSLLVVVGVVGVSRERTTPLHPRPSVDHTKKRHPGVYYLTGHDSSFCTPHDLPESRRSNASFVRALCPAHANELTVREPSKSIFVGFFLNERTGRFPSISRVTIGRCRGCVNIGVSTVYAYKRYVTRRSGVENARVA